MELLHTLFYFVVAISVLVAFHEFGHFWVARKCGVKVLRFSIGFGKIIYSYQKTPESTEYVLSSIPLGGYVKMVDEREDEVEEKDLPFAFNRKSLLARAAIVAAGPIFNLILAIMLYWGAAVIGEIGMRPIVGEVKENTFAYKAGFVTGEEIISVNDKKTPTWTEVMDILFSAIINSEQGIEITTQNQDGLSALRILNIPEDAAQKPEELYQNLGLEPWFPDFKPIFGKIIEGRPASKSGLQEGDLLISADGIKINDWMQWVDYIEQHPNVSIKLIISRNDVHIPVTITPEAFETDKGVVGKIGAAVYVPDEVFEALRVHHSLPIGEAFVDALRKTWYYAFASLKMMGKMFIGKASVDNLSGPISIAQYAGQSAEMGFVHFLKFMALVSVSLGILNLLPIPMLDGGHLMFYAVEAVKGSPVSDRVQIVFQQIGILLLMSLMLFAIFLDLGRLFE